MIEDWNPSKDDLLKVERLINADQLEYDDLIQRKKSLEYDLSIIKNQIRTGGQMNQSDYDAICRNQDRIIKEVRDIQEPIKIIKKKLRERQLMRDEIKGFLDGEIRLYDDVKAKVVYLRDFYTQFAGDATRVSSTRIMASKFVEELQDLLKIILKK